jgi:hypothetical protein
MTDAGSIKCEYCKKIELRTKDEYYNGCTHFFPYKGRIVGFHEICFKVFSSMQDVADKFANQDKTT